MNKRINLHGDTIIEVVLSMALLSMILFTSWSLVNRATQLSLAARKRIDMVNQMKEQAEILQSSFSSNQGKAQDMINNELLPAIQQIPGTSYSEDFCKDVSLVDSSYGVYYYNDAAKVTKGLKDARGYENSKIWIQYKAGPSAEYYDFYIRGCWATLGGQQKTDNSQIIVRLNK